MDMTKRPSLAEGLAISFALWLALGFAWQAGAAVELPTASIEAAVRRHVLEQLHPGAGETPMVRVLQVPGGPCRFADVDRPEQVAIQAESNLARQVTDRAVVRVKLHPERGGDRLIGVPVEIHMKRPVWVVTAPLQPGQPLNGKVLRQEEREIGHDLARMLPMDAKPTDYQARVVLKPGQVLDSTNVGRIPTIRRLQDVRIWLQSPAGMKVSVLGQALEDGFVGGAIRVRQKDFKRRDYTARVVGRGNVVVDL